MISLLKIDKACMRFLQPPLLQCGIPLRSQPSLHAPSPPPPSLPQPCPSPCDCPGNAGAVHAKPLTSQAFPILGRKLALSVEALKAFLARSSDVCVLGRVKRVDSRHAGLTASNVVLAGAQRALGVEACEAVLRLLRRVDESNSETRDSWRMRGWESENGENGGEGETAAAARLQPTRMLPGAVTSAGKQTDVQAQVP
eukprot:347236-Chlamydomonas_euryale.AAC.1